VGEVNDFYFGDDGDDIVKAFGDLSVTLQQFSEAIVVALGIPTPIPDNFEDIVQQIMIDNHIWDEVDFDRLTPGQRWEYQKWVWGAPGRWIRALMTGEDD
jgi:hypothetical protein